MSPEVDRYTRYREQHYTKPQRLMHLLIDSYDASGVMTSSQFEKFLAESLGISIKEIHPLRKKLRSLGVDTGKKRMPERVRVRRRSPQILEFDLQVKKLFVDGLTYKEIAERLNSYKSAVGNSLARLRKESPELRRR